MFPEVGRTLHEWLKMYTVATQLAGIELFDELLDVDSLANVTPEPFGRNASGLISAGYSDKGYFSYVSLRYKKRKEPPPDNSWERLYTIEDARYPLKMILTPNLVALPLHISSHYSYPHMLANICNEILQEGIWYPVRMERGQLVIP